MKHLSRSDPGQYRFRASTFLVRQGKLEFGLVFFLFLFRLGPRSFDLGDTGLGYYFAIFGYFISMERFCLIERKTDWYRTDFFIACAHGWIFQRIVQYGVKFVENRLRHARRRTKPEPAVKFVFRETGLCRGRRSR